MNKDPSYKEMVEHLSSYDKALDEVTIAAAIYHFAASHHGGQSSNLYEALSNSPYKPGAAGSKMLEGEVLEAYNELARAFFGKDYIRIRNWNNQERAKEAAAALVAFNNAKGEVTRPESVVDDIEDLIVNLLHLARLHLDEFEDIDTEELQARVVEELIELPGDAKVAAILENEEVWEVCKPGDYTDIEQP